MPRFEKLSAAEVRRLQAPGGRPELADYVEFLQKLRPGDWARVVIAPRESARAVKRRLGAAGRLLRRQIHFLDTGKKTELLFSVDRRRPGRPRRRRRMRKAAPRAAAPKAPEAAGTRGRARPTPAPEKPRGEPVR
ncbi:MAG: hypothetical protein QN173_10905 [Armatimonadota bacterium]|nr:hypothetical protein [Armatimonadota bacterium]MDR7402360.1 hypothetical protein [Armatimonadota bacterium]MDR7437345.1 hypothetical protein [Armatimonadota bacterium]MDR7472684.1 hypothetical protein [Armatimonadota bacterium]MDR7508101.1 hypothetical protein [Armatimonadota bacterium]